MLHPFFIFTIEIKDSGISSVSPFGVRFNLCKKSPALASLTAHQVIANPIFYLLWSAPAGSDSVVDLVVKGQFGFVAGIALIVTAAIMLFKNGGWLLAFN
jgi:hypothetical protein